jgi:hypothetical protein
MSNETIVQRCLRFFAVFLLGLTHYFKKLYRENEKARVVIDFVFLLFGGAQEIIQGARPKLPDTEKWTEWIQYDFTTRRAVDVFGQEPEQNEDGGLSIQRVNSGLYLVKNGQYTEGTHESSKERFITVQYIHPHMALPLTLEIPPGMYQKGNQLLDSTFVYWCLKYQYQASEYVFDENYKVEIIDNDMNMISLRSNQYIHFEETRGYKIVTL